MAETLALVAGGVDHGESDRVVHLLTPRGCLDVFAPGARRSKRRFAGAFRPFQTLEIATHPSRRSRPGLATATSARVLAPRIAISTELERIALASHAVELGRRVAPEGEPSAAFLRVSEVLDHLERHPAQPAVRRAFEVRLLASLGYHPATRRCALCGRESPPFRVDFDAGGLLCPAHGPRGDRVGPGTQAWLVALLEDPGFAPAGPHDVADAQRAAKTMGPALDRFFAQLLVSPLRSRALINELGL